MLKSFFFSVVAVMAACSAMAQPAARIRQDGHHLARIHTVEQMAAQKSPYQLTRMYTSDGYEVQRFSYDYQGRLVAVADSLNADVDSYFVIDSMHYNDQGQLVRYAGWQYFTDGPRNVYYIEYTYDSRGDLVSRTNYNNFGGSWELGGVYNYTYNDDHQILTSTLTMSLGVIQRVEWTYSQGRLLKELWYAYDWDASQLYPNEVHWCQYDALGQLVLQTDSTSDDGQVWTSAGDRTYAYDDRGNCVLFEATDFSGDISERSEYRYDLGILLSDVDMPAYPEMERPKTYHNFNALSVESWWTLDVDHNLQYVCDYHYEYNGHAVAVPAVDVQPLRVTPNPASALVMLEGLGSEPQEVRLLDASGREVFSGRLSAFGTIDVSSLPSGIYLLQAGPRTAKLSVR